ncbi:MAG: hypothetical protein II730_10735, partial [Bacteroidales bacterium]|nr:hypothetical protein [Bacteroidales bacterium]
MTSKSIISAMTLTLGICLSAYAHQSRYDVLPVHGGGIIFAGDNITDDSEWNELFGRTDILNRGIDGNTSATVLDTGLKCEAVDSLGAKIWRISAKRRSGLADRTVNPTYFIYPDRPVNDPMQTVKAFGMENHIDEYLANVYVVNPAGSKYDSSKDLEVYYKLLERLRSINNLKLIGKGAGATFINNVLTSHDEMVSGILTIGGTIKSHTANIPVPTYVASSAKAVADYYISANNASAAGSGVYENPSHPVERVVVDAAKMTDAEAFAKAWKEIFSRNYRYNNYHTWYTGTDLRNTVPFEFVSYVMFDRLGIRRNIVEENICGWGDFLWYEYIPERLLSAPKNSVPLVIMLHGNNNDPRT